MICKEVLSVTPSKKDGFIKIDFKDPNGDTKSVTTSYKSYCKWLIKNKDTYGSVFGDYVNNFVDSSLEDEDLTEIIDKHGNIMPDDDKPNNATNKMVGDSKFDLDKVYKQTVPMGSWMYSGDYGVGYITW